MTIKDIARESGYAVSTVSRALNDHPDVSPEAKRRIREIVERHGFVPNANARQLKAQQSKSICVIVKGASNMFFAGILERMQAHIAERGYIAEVHYIDEDANELAVGAQLAQLQKPLGMVFLGGCLEDFGTYFQRINVPCVMTTSLTKELDFPGLSIVGVDDAEAGEAACRYLTARGHRHIGLLGGNQGLSYISKQRHDGFVAGYAKTGRNFDESYYQASSFSMEGGYAGMKKLLERHPQLTAVFCMSDLIAVGAMRAIHDEGLRVPEDLSVMGFDGIPLANFSIPRLASMRQPQEKLAGVSIDVLVRQIEKGAKAALVILEAVLVEGESVQDRYSAGQPAADTNQIKERTNT